MAFWDYLVYVRLGGKWLAKVSQCIQKTTDEKGKVGFWDYLRCLGESTEAINEKGKGEPAKRRTKASKVKIKPE